MFRTSKIGFKIGSVFALVSLVGLASLIVISIDVRKTNITFETLIHQEIEGSVWLARASRRVIQIGYESYGAITADTSSPAFSKASSAAQSSYDRYREMFANAVKLLPSRADSLSAIDAQVARIAELCRDARDAKAGGDDRRAAAIMKQADVLVGKAGADIIEATRSIADEVRAKTDATREGAEFRSLSALVVSGLLGIAAFAAALVLVRRSVTGPLARLSGSMKTLAEGRFDTDIAGADRRDEIGAMARAVHVFREAGIAKLRLESEAAGHGEEIDAERRRTAELDRAAADVQASIVHAVGTGLSRLASGDLTTRLSGAFPPDSLKLQSDFNAAVETLQQTIVTIVRATGHIQSGTGEISQASDDLSRRTEQQAASLEETAAALDEITATVRKTADGAEHARTIVAAAKGDAERSGEIVADAITAMAGIERSSGQISQIIAVIDEIAFQTNLLALNAGVEAARAGEAGRGFAVVASEVRALAQRSADAAKEIKTLIRASGSQVAEGVGLVGQAGRALGRIAAQVADINAVVLEIAASAKEQATGLAEVNTAVNQMDQVTQQNAAMVEQSTAASHGLAREADELGRLVARFQVGPASGRVLAQQGAQASIVPMRKPAPAALVPTLKIAGGRHASAARKLAPAPAQDGWEEF